jgi:heme-degrading monooxygenase HmoA
MIVEHAVLEVRPSEESELEEAFKMATQYISSTAGFVSLQLLRCLEQDNQYLFLVEWDSLEAHTEGFRGSDAYEKWRQLLHHFYEPFPTVEHFEVVLEKTGG